MPSYQSSKFRAGSTPAEAKKKDGVDPQFQQLQEMFPSWSEDDLKSLLIEVNNDYELAAARISEGHAEQWGSVSRKKEKRTPAGGAPPRELRDSTGGRESIKERGESRGGRGGRGGGRGGRGGGLRGVGRGGHRETNGRHTPSTPTAAGATDDAPTSSSRDQDVKEGAAAATATAGEAWGNGSAAGASNEGWGDTSAPATKKEELPASSEAVSTPAPVHAQDAPAKATGAWANGSAAIKSAEKKPPTPAPAPAPVSTSITPAPAPASGAAAPVAKPTATKPSEPPKKSWAQIARPQEKPKPAPAPTHAPPPPAPVVIPEPAPAPSPAAPLLTSAPEPESQPQTQPESQGWEEPTTAQAPTWDDEPQQQQHQQEVQPKTTLPVTADGWITSPPAPLQPTVIKTEEPPAPPSTTTKAELEPTAAPAPAPVQVPAPTPPSAFPAQLNLHQQQPPQKAAVSPVAVAAKPATPVGALRGSGVPRSASRFKTTDQAVVMPSAFNASIDKLGMQFGSVGLGGDDFDNIPEPTSEPTRAPEPPAPAPVVEAPIAQKPVVQKPATPESPAAPAPVAPQAQVPSQTSITTQSLFQQALPQQTQQVQLQATQQTPPSLLNTQATAHSTISSQAASSTAASSPLTGFSTQQTTPSQTSISPYQQHTSQQQQQQQTPASQTQAPAVQSQATQPQSQQSQLHQQFPHFTSHLEPPSLNTQSTAQSTQQQQQQQHQQQSALHQGIGGHTSFYRQPTEYFHAATPPAGQAQEPTYNSFNPLGQQLGHQTQGSHLGGGFGGGDHFGYNEAPRSFYDSYGQQQGFGGRNVLGHDDMGKSLSGPQQPSQATSGLPQSAAQAGSQPGSQQPQTGSQPQGPSAGQPQQGYATAPLPYYYNPYHQPSQYYGPPYGSTYGLAGQYAAGRFQPQQPPMFQPPNPTSAASPANAKGPSGVGVGVQGGIQAGLQPQSNPYAAAAAAQGLYGQQLASSAYDDGYGSHHGQLGHGQGVGGLPTNEYGKQLYGAQGIQGFMGISQSHGAGTPSAAPLSQRGASAGTSSGSPENTYKPYGATGAGIGVGGKDVNGPGGVAGSIAGGQGALGGGQGSRGGIQQPHAQHQHSQGFYGANRFSASQNNSGPPGQQGQQQQSGQGYGGPQGGAEGNFYYQRAPSQQQYWQ